jgi:hypothetical protein
MQKNKRKKAGQASFDTAQEHSEFNIDPNEQNRRNQDAFASDLTNPRVQK